MTVPQLAPALSRKSLTNTYRYAGGTISILIGGEDTGGMFSMWESVQKPGSEPPLHVHNASDETFYVLEGNMRFMIGEQIFEAAAGDMIFAPRRIPHTFRIKSPIVRAITVCTPPGAEEWFRQMGEPATSFDLPDEVVPFSESDFPRMLALSKKLEVEFIQREVNF
jgi:mannose-6-phosphate isomerase-like protein (cupin superfamily)